MLFVEWVTGREGEGRANAAGIDVAHVRQEAKVLGAENGQGSFSRLR